MFSSVILPRGGPWSALGGALMGHPRALMGRALTAPLGPHGPGPCGPHWALMGRALVGSPGPLWAPLGPYGPGPCGLPEPLRAGPLWATLGPRGPGPCGPPLGPCGRTHAWNPRSQQAKRATTERVEAVMHLKLRAGHNKNYI